MTQWRSLLAVALILSAQGGAAAIIASSTDDFSNEQGRDGWSYGFFDAGGDPASLTPYTSAAFRAFDAFDAATWRASDALQPRTVCERGSEAKSAAASGDVTLTWVGAMRRQ